MQTEHTDRPDLFTFKGFTRENLLTAYAAEKWEQYRKAGVQQKGHDTLSLLGLDAAGNIGAVVSTSGMAFKQAGRVGDSPLPGA